MTASIAEAGLSVVLVPITLPAFEAACWAIRDGGGERLDVDDVLFGRQDVPASASVPPHLVVDRVLDADGEALEGEALDALAPVLTALFFAAARAQCDEAAATVSYYADRCGVSGLGIEGSEVSIRRIVHRDGPAAARMLLAGSLRDLLTDLLMAGVDYAASHAADYLS
ncbi:MAG: hypothetical protein IAE99_08210 [Rhodothermales bacterium]|nr:hypothetical protein [Rhodothermales bacterium]